jgi:4-amino-4-deoxy-L-arabinose transferase-like glycosyltransferase
MSWRHRLPNLPLLLVFGIGLGYVRAVSAPEQANPSARRWSAYAWGAIGAAIVFIALTCWWLTQDRSIPIYDAGDHLETALSFHQMLKDGNLLGPFNFESPYPPFVPTIGALSVFVGGVNLATPIIGENLVFVSLLTLGCYKTGRLLFGPKAGMLAAIFVLGSDLLTAQLHVFMIDAPEAAVVAVSIWLILACEDFNRVGLSGVAGLAVGIGLVTKVQYPSFVIGIVLMALLRGGWRNRRGLLRFAAAALIVGAPWYLDHLSQFSTFVQVSTANPIVVPGDIPATVSIASFTWYFWNILNTQLLFPLFTLLLGGTVWMIVTLVCHRRGALGVNGANGAPESVGDGGSSSVVSSDERLYAARLEFFVGAFVAWLFITLTPSHDVRYGIPLLPYLAVIATGWIVFLPRTARRVAIAVLALGVIANMLGTTFGLGNTVQVALVHRPPPGEQAADTVTFYSTAGFLVAGPRRDGDVPGLLEALRRHGVSTVAWMRSQGRGPDFSSEGLLPLTRIAKLSHVLTETTEYSRYTKAVTLIHQSVGATSPPACTRLSDGTGVWVVRHDDATGELALFCPTRRPRFYDSGVIRCSGPTEPFSAVVPLVSCAAAGARHPPTVACSRSALGSTTRGARSPRPSACSAACACDGRRSRSRSSPPLAPPRGRARRTDRGGRGLR